jgi:hypothetical protein
MLEAYVHLKGERHFGVNGTQRNYNLRRKSEQVLMKWEAEHKPPLQKQFCYVRLRRVSEETRLNVMRTYEEKAFHTLEWNWRMSQKLSTTQWRQWRISKQTLGYELGEAVLNAGRKAGVAGLPGSYRRFISDNWALVCILYVVKYITVHMYVTNYISIFSSIWYHTQTYPSTKTQMFMSLWRPKRKSNDFCKTHLSLIRQFNEP